jgi:hypothetical protein
VEKAHSPLGPARQVVEFANHFQKHSDLNAVSAKPLIDQALLPA